MSWQNLTFTSTDDNRQTGDAWRNTRVKRLCTVGRRIMVAETQYDYRTKPDVVLWHSYYMHREWTGIGYGKVKTTKIQRKPSLITMVTAASNGGKSTTVAAFKLLGASYHHGNRLRAAYDKLKGCRSFIKIKQQYSGKQKNWNLM